LRLILIIVILATTSLQAQTSDSLPERKISVMVIPYMPAMHMSDADQDIAEESQMEIGQVRAEFRKGIIRKMNQRFVEVYDAQVPNESFVASNTGDIDMIYHSLAFESDSTSPMKNPKKFAVVDTAITGKKTKKKEIDKTYINAVPRDPQLLPDFAKKYNADYFVMLNEFDIKTHFDDCIDLALKIYRRDLKFHYTIYNHRGEKLYGDVAVVHFPSNENNVEQIVEANFGKVADYVFESLRKVKE
jgi:hypothetical protein